MNHPLTVGRGWSHRNLCLFLAETALFRQGCCTPFDRHPPMASAATSGKAVWLGQAGFSGMVAALWDALAPEDRRRLVFGMVWHPSTIPYPIDDASQQLMVFTAPAESRQRFDSWPVVLLEGRPGHPGLANEEALRAMGKEVGPRLDPECFEALSQLIGVAVPESLKRQWPSGLTDREVEILRISATGLTKRQMAQHLIISEKTVGTHLEHIYNKIGCSSRAAAVLFAMEHGLLR